MKLNRDLVEAAFTRFSGETPNSHGSQREALCAALCAQCAQQVEGQVRPSLTQEELELWEASLEELAGAQAFYQLLLAEEAVTPQSLSAGDLRVVESSRSQRAAKLAEEKRRAASPALVETDFFFGRVPEVDCHGPR